MKGLRRCALAAGNARDGGEEERRVIEGGGGFDRNIYKERKGCVWLRRNKGGFGYLKPKLAIVYSF